ncbi:hypothetical protein C1924_02215 [Stenotrophomonas sp. ESTM1D_MKCIP4_1]|uniref:hypothetical protein n=1 Tax=Stenotrophomonas sp. ESTM1D_MKCIP4_1 TaxID=2072414 RepID=UPI000D53EF81|nr:hypothetical protein [Stenotrophomonas sp. ESTM1D_MKCIP4_1]AWH52085.1 hypothetical protein C1924_02215 [Stenotrophomonas sp. ESTM1D_MKCIP4_1]
MPSRFHASLLLAGLCLSTCSAASARNTDTLERACAAAAMDDRIELIPVEGSFVSACPPGDDEACPYSGRQGKTSLSDTPDLNNDGRKDAVLTYFGSSYGTIDATDRLVLAQCPDGMYIRLLEGRFTTLIAPAAPHAIWPALEATRDCPVGQSGTVRTERMQLQFDPTALRYRAPAGVDLLHACSE